MERQTEARRRPRRILWGLRTRFVVWSVVALAAAIGVAVLVVRQVLVAQTDRRIQEALVQESEELRRLAGGRDPTTGRQFGDDVERIFEVFLQRNIPTRNEALLTFVDGQSFGRSFRPPPYRLDQDPDLVRRWGSLTRPDQGRVDTPAGAVDYLAVPLRRGGEVRGVFVSAFFRDLELEEIGRAVWGAAGVGGATLLIGSLLAWSVANGILRRVDAVTETARRSSTVDLSRRLEVRGHDELSRLSETFNSMLDRLEEAFEGQRRFLADAGHELRTPITVIRGHLELLDDAPRERARTLALVTDELERMQRIVDDLLVLARAERPDFLELEPVRLDGLAEEVQAKARGLGDRGWRIDEAASGIVIGDRQRLTQAMMEIARNAALHTDEGAEIAVGTAMRSGEARLWIRDTGTGMAEQDLSRIFERFARGPKEVRSDGAGLGLAIVSAIAQAHHGRVDVESRLGVGSTFTVIIPVDQPTLPPAEGS